MGRARTRSPFARKRKGAELIVKQSYGLGSGFTEDFFPMLQVFGNRSGFKWLSEYFAWLADRPVDTDPKGPDPGDHVHLRDASPPCVAECSDELDFTFVTLTPDNRIRLLRMASVTQRSRLRGSPLKQFAVLIEEMIRFLEPFLENDLQFRKRTMKQLERLLEVCEQRLAELKKRG